MDIWYLSTDGKSLAWLSLDESLLYIGAGADEPFVKQDPSAFVPVTGISGVPDAATAGETLELTGTVAPANATNNTIRWSVKSAGTTGAEISGEMFYATSAGTATITATVASGTSAISKSKATYQKYEVTRKHLADFIKRRYNLSDISLKEINNLFINDFEVYLMSTAGCNANTTAKFMQFFKRIIIIARNNGWIFTDPFCNYKIRIAKVDRGNPLGLPFCSTTPRPFTIIYSPGVL